MKRIALACFLLLFAQNLLAQETLTETEKLASLCKVWGFLKYYHPKVAKGQHDWDKELVDHYAIVLAAKNKEALSNIYLDWIASLGKVKACKSCSTPIPDSLKFNLDLRWLDDDNLFTDSLTRTLHFIEQNRNHGTSYYARKAYAGNAVFNLEKVYPGMAYPSYEYRLLSLYRYWNIIDYFYPYKYIIGEDWNNVLDEMIPKFRFAKDTTEYHLAMLELVCRINDSHARFWTRYTYKYLCPKWVSFSVKFIDDKPVVNEFYNDSFAKLDDMRYGDVISEINGLNITEVLKEKIKYVNGSNMASKLYQANNVLFNGSEDSLNITFERNGIIKSKYIHRYSFDQFHYKWSKGGDPYKVLDNNIGYINMGVLKRSEVKEAMKALWNTKAIIFDVRNYPNGTMYKIANYLNSEPKLFAKFTYPMMEYPGVYYKPSALYTCGRKNKNYYKGKVIILFDERTQSHAEFTCMALQTVPNAVSIGSQTSGADGNVSEIIFPGGYITHISGIGVYYPDGRETQRIGIVPDIEVKPTIEGIRNRKDEVLERAVTYILTGK